MMKKISPLILLTLCLAATPATGQMQETAGIQEKLQIPAPGHVQILTARNGSTHIGRIVEVDSLMVRFETNFGLVAIPILEIEKIEEVEKRALKNGQYWFRNPNATRLYFSPTARMLKQGQGYFSNYYLFFPGMAYGLTNYLTIGGGMSVFPGVAFDKQLLYFAPKVGLAKTGSSSLAAGALFIRIPDVAPSSVGILYSVGTYGDPDGSITVGLGYGFEDSALADKPMLMLGGEKRLSRRTAFVTENWVIPGLEEPLISYGFRFFSKGLSVDFGFMNILGGEAIFPGVPYIDFVFNFGAE